MTARLQLRRLYDHLITRFPSNQIFIDVDNLDPGVDFVEAIEESVGSCDVLIAVIGRRWIMSSDDEGKRRLDNSEDYVRLEIATALKRGVRVIPVLVDGASMPRSGELPEGLKTLVRRNALEINHTRFRADSERLIDAVERGLAALTAKQPKREEVRSDAEQHERDEKEQLEPEQREREVAASNLGFRASVASPSRATRCLVASYRRRSRALRGLQPERHPHRLVRRRQLRAALGCQERKPYRRAVQGP